MEKINLKNYICNNLKKKGIKEKLRIFRKIIICSTNKGATRVSYVSVLIRKTNG